MKIRYAIDSVAAIVIYGFLAAIIFLSPATWFLGTDLSMDSTKDARLLAPMINTFQSDAIIVLVASLVCFLLWYLLAEFLVSHKAPVAHWRILWGILLVVILGVAGYEIYDAIIHLGDPHNYSIDAVAAFYLLSGGVFYYICSLFFSPPNAKTTIWPAKRIRG